ncbi:MAG: hypothetical protein Tsb0033_04040 [Winogradskyella sp.]|jgi:hypothetical protein
MFYEFEFKRMGELLRLAHIELNNIFNTKTIQLSYSSKVNLRGVFAFAADTLI